MYRINEFVESKELVILFIAGLGYLSVTDKFTTKREEAKVLHPETAKVIALNYRAKNYGVQTISVK